MGRLAPAHSDRHTEAKAEKAFVDRGIVIKKLTPEEREEMKRLTRPVWDEFKNEIPAELIQLIQDAQK